MNSAGPAVGYSDISLFDPFIFDLVTAERAVVWKNGAMIPLPTLSGGEFLIFNRASAINDAGYVVGSSPINAGEGHAVLWDAQGNIKDLGSLPNANIPSADARDVDNNLVYIVGASTYENSGNAFHALLYEYTGWQNPGIMTDLGTLQGFGDSSASAVNDVGQVVGWSDTSVNTPRAAFLWDDANGMRDLNTLIPANSGWYLLEATDINQLGQISGEGVLNGQRHGFVLLQDDDPPQILCAGADGLWHGDNVSIACTASDAVAGLVHPSEGSFSLSTTVASGAENANASTDTRTICDAVGNCTTAGPITGNKIDRKVPGVSCGAADDSWHASNVTIPCTATDAGSSLASPSDASFSLATTVAAGVETADASTGTRNVCDVVGNCTTAGPIGGNKIDRKPPAVTITAPTSTTYVLNQKVPASYSCVDGGSGAASCVGPIPSGSNADTASVGTKTFTVNTTDNVGNAGSQSVDYKVAYKICLLYDPTRAYRCGTTISLRLQLCDVNDANVSSPGIALTAISIDPGGLCPPAAQTGTICSS